jgi:hypothetical protein
MARLVFAHSLLAALASAAAAAVAAPALPPLPALSIAGPLTVSGISSGADFASAFHVAFGASVSASAAFAGQAVSCATTLFAGEAPVASCAAQSPDALGAGCVGLATTGAAPCVGCGAGQTLQYDHCKKSPNATAQPELLAALVRQAAELGFVDDAAGLADGFHKAFAYRGTKDTVYLPGSVNTTIDTFVALGVLPRDTHFEAGVPSQHAMPSTDPAVPPSSCGVGDPSLPGLENCGYDGAGEMFKFFFADLVQPAAGAQSIPANLYAFNQTLYEVGPFAGLASTGFIYVPARCARGANPCVLHAAFHGCGQYALLPSVNRSFARTAATPSGQSRMTLSCSLRRWAVLLSATSPRRRGSCRPVVGTATGKRGPRTRGRAAHRWRALPRCFAPLAGRPGGGGTRRRRARAMPVSPATGRGGAPREKKGKKSAAHARQRQERVSPFRTLALRSPKV